MRRFSALKNRLSIALVVFGWLSASAAASDRTGLVEFRSQTNSLLITVDGQQVATYVYSDPQIRRPYFAHVKAPGGLQVTRNHPPIPDRDPTDHATMHPGIWLAFGDLSGADFWRNKATVSHKSFVGQPIGGKGKGVFEESKVYAREDGTIVCSERFRCEFHLRPAGYLLVWDSTFSASSQFYFGDQEEMGLGLRVTTAISENKGGTILDGTGRVSAARIWSQAANWCDYSGPVGDRHLGMTVFCHPKNFRPSWLHARNYGLLAANPFGRKAFQKGDTSRVIVKPGDSFRLRFGVLSHAGLQPTRQDLDAAYEDYLTVAAGPER